MVAMITCMCRSVLKNIFYKLQLKYLFCKILKNVKLTGTFSVRKRQKCKIVASEIGVEVNNWPLNYRGLD